MTRFVVIAAVASLLVAALAAVAVADKHATGIERAKEATLQGLEKSQGKAAEAPGQVNRAKGLENKEDKLTGRERAAAAIAAAMERGNGQGNAYGRGNAAYVHEILASGEIPGQIERLNHGQQVKEMVHAYNELRKAAKDS